MQISCINLARLGFVVLNIDPFEQGERRHGWKLHGHIESILVGITQTSLMVYENMGALDYLESRKEVDVNRIGMMGTSGGASNTIYTTPFDERIKAAVLICYSVTYTGLLEGQKGNNFDSGNDLCDQIPFAFNSFTLPQVLALIAPRPVMIVSAKEDLHFPIKSALELFNEAKLYFDLYGKDLIKQRVVAGPHGEGKEARETAYGFFSKWLLSKGDGSPIAEPETIIEERPYDIHYMDATADRNRVQSFMPKKGLPTQVFDAPSLKEIQVPLSNMFREIANKKYASIKIPATLHEFEKLKSRYKERLNSIMVKTIDHNFLNPREISGTEYPGYYIERILLDSEAGITIPCLFFLPDEWIKPNDVWLCIDDNGKNGFIYNPMFDYLINEKQAIFTVDLRGQGELLALEFEVATMCYMLDRSLFSMRIFDLLRALEYLSTRASNGIQINKQRIFCYGRNISALIALFAGAIDDRIAGVFTERQIASYRNLLEGDFRLSASIFLFDIMSSFEIDDIASLNFPKPLVILNPVDKNNKELDIDNILEIFKFTNHIYQKFNKNNQLFIRSSKKDIHRDLINKLLMIK